jgi:hypothetical protein
LFGVVEDEEESIEENAVTLDGFLSEGWVTWASRTSTWKMMLRALNIDRRMFILKLGSSSSR